MDQFSLLHRIQRKFVPFSYKIKFWSSFIFFFVLNLFLQSSLVPFIKRCQFFSGIFLNVVHLIVNRFAAIRITTSKDSMHLLASEIILELRPSSQVCFCILVIVVESVKFLKDWVILKIRPILVHEIEEQEMALIILVVNLLEKFVSLFLQSPSERLSHKR